MSRIHSGLGQEDCACVARSLRLAGYATSIRMEVAFWNILDEIAATEGKTTARYRSDPPRHRCEQGQVKKEFLLSG